MLERDLQSRVIDLAKLRGWLVMHQRPARMASGEWRTAVEGHAGFPDLVLARNGFVLFRELKSDNGRLSPQQSLWGQHLPNWAVWRPADWDTVIVPTLGGLVGVSTG